jgi:hypothetical protein
MQVDDSAASTADGRPSDSSAAIDPVPVALPELEPEIGLPDEASARFMDRRLIAHRLSVLSGEHLQVNGLGGWDTGRCAYLQTAVWRTSSWISLSLKKEVASKPSLVGTIC